MFPPIVARYPVFCVWTVVFGIQKRGTDCGAPINIGLLDKNQPTRGAVPAFFSPPHVFVLLQIDAALRAARPAEKYTIIYTTKIF
jgi:hypothetical protein